jgi:hypothetical protein
MRSIESKTKSCQREREQSGLVCGRPLLLFPKTPLFCSVQFLAVRQAHGPRARLPRVGRPSQKQYSMGGWGHGRPASACWNKFSATAWLPPPCLVGRVVVICGRERPDGRRRRAAAGSDTTRPKHVLASPVSRRKPEGGGGGEAHTHTDPGGGVCQNDEELVGCDWGCGGPARTRLRARQPNR